MPPVLLNPYRFGSGAVPVSFIQRSSDVWVGGGRTLGPHGSAAIGDRQIMAVATHSSVTPTISAGGWTQLSRTTTTHSSLTIWTRVTDASTVGANVTLNSGANAGAEFRTYRGGSVGFTSLANGTGLVASSIAITTWLLRFTATARDNIGGGGTNGGTLTPDAALLNKSPGCVWEWYSGIVAGDDPTTPPATAPSRTATDTCTATTYPQWVDVGIS